MNEVSKSQLKARMLEYFRQIEDTGRELVVTDHGRPVAKIVPLTTRRTARELFGDLRGRVVYHADVVASTTDEWPES